MSNDIIRWRLLTRRKPRSDGLEIVSVHKLHDSFKFIFSESYMHDLCDAMCAEFELACSGAVYEYDPTKRAPNEWLTIDFIGQSMEWSRDTMPEINHLPKLDRLQERGWFIIDYDTQKIYTNDIMFSAILEFVYTELYNLDHLFDILKGIHYLIVYLVPFHCEKYWDIDHGGVYETFLTLRQKRRYDL